MAQRASLASWGGVLVLLLGLSLGALAPAQDDEPPAGATREKPRREVAGRVARAGRKARFRRPGAANWQPLTPDVELGTGDEVQAKGDPLELVLPESDADGRNSAVYTGDRVILAPGAKVTVDPPGSAAGLRLDEGACFAIALRLLRVAAGGGLLELRGSDAEMKLSSGGAGVTVVVHAGEDVRLDAGSRGNGRYALGQRVRLDARGLSEPRKVKPKRPRYVIESERVDPAQVLFYEDFKAWPGDYDEAFGERCPDGVTGVLELDDDGAPLSPQEIRLGRVSQGGERGLYVQRSRARVRVRYRLSHPLQLLVKTTNRTKGDNFVGVTAETRPHAWTEVEFLPEAFVDKAGEGKRLEPEDLITYLSIVAGEVEDRDRGARLEVARILVYVPR